MEAVGLRELVQLAERHRQAPGEPGQPILLVDLEGLESLSPQDAALLARRLPDDLRVHVGVRTTPLPALLIGPGQAVLERLAFTISPRPADPSHLDQMPQGPASGVSTVVRVDDPLSAARAILDQGLQTPEAVHFLDTTLRIAEHATARESLIVESHGYTSLLAGPEYERLSREVGSSLRVGPPAEIRSEFADRRCDITIDWTGDDSGMDARVRRDLARALLDARPHREAEIHLRASGPDFCARPMADDDPDTPRARDESLKRLRLHPGVAAWLVHRRLSVQVQGRCTSAGLELVAFASSASAAPDTVFSVPHVRLGLMFGAGGTVSLSRRIGRWRTTFLALGGEEIDAPTALRWGLIDAIDGESSRPGPPAAAASSAP